MLVSVIILGQEEEFLPHIFPAVVEPPKAQNVFFLTSKFLVLFLKELTELFSSFKSIKFTFNYFHSHFFNIFIYRVYE